MTNGAITLHNAKAAQIRVNTAMKSLSSTLEGGLVSGLTDITMGTKTAGQGFKDMGTAVVKAIDEMIIKMMIVGPLMRGLQGMLGPTTYTAAPTVGPDGIAAVHHTGGIVGGDSMPTRFIHSAHFNDAPRFHDGGIAGDEVPIVARKGEGVFTQGQMAALGGGGGANVTVNVVNNTGTQAQVSQSTAPNGDITVTLDKAVDNAVGKSLSSGTGMRVLSKQYGVNQFTGQ
jgi:hypothetical protein